MAKAGSSSHVRPAERLASNNHHANALQASSDVQFPQRHAGFGPRLHSDETVIGLALGSPRQSPTLAMSPNEPDIDVSWAYGSLENNSARSLGDACEIGSESRSIKRKGSKWKSFGSFFGKRELQSASPSHLQDQKHQPESFKPLVVRAQLETDAPLRPRADWDYVSKLHCPGFSKHISRKECSGLLRRNSSQRRGLRRRKFKEPHPEMQQIPAGSTADAIADNLDGLGEQQRARIPGLLQVEIPCVAMERYSVMFGEVLQSQAWQTKWQPSLLACGQAHLEELHTVSDPNTKVRCYTVMRNEVTSLRMLHSLLTLPKPVCKPIQHHSSPPGPPLSHDSARLLPSQPAAR